MNRLKDCTVNIYLDGYNVDDELETARDTVTAIEDLVAKYESGKKDEYVELDAAASDFAGMTPTRELGVEQVRELEDDPVSPFLGSTASSKEYNEARVLRAIRRDIQKGFIMNLPAETVRRRIEERIAALDRWLQESAEGHVPGHAELDQ